MPPSLPSLAPSPFPTHPPQVSLPDNYTQFLDPGVLAGARIGVLSQISTLPGADPGVQALFDQALAAIAQAGATLVDNFNITGNRYGLDWQANRWGAAHGGVTGCALGGQVGGG